MRALRVFLLFSTLGAHETGGTLFCFYTGKSSLVIQFIENHFVESYYPTIESTFSKTINLNGVNYDCDIIDTAGQVRTRLTAPYRD